MSHESTRMLLWSILASAVLLAGWLFAPLLAGVLVIFAGILLAVFLVNLSSQIAKLLSLPYNFAFAIVVLAIVALLAASGYFMGSQLFDHASRLVQEFDQASADLIEKLQSQPWWQGLAPLGEQGQQAQAIPKAVSTATAAASNILSVIAGCVLVLFLGFYFALQPAIYRAGLVALIKPSARSRVSKMLDSITGALWRWILGRLVGMTVIGIGTTLGLAIIGIPMPFTLGVLAGVLTFVPNIGPLVAAIPALLLGLQQGTQPALWVAGLYFGLQFVESYFLTPLIEQHQISLPPGLILSSQLLFGILAGVLGLILATPLTVVLVICVQQLYLAEKPGSENNLNDS